MRTLVLSIGNTSLFGGVFNQGKRVAHFRVSIKAATPPRVLARQALARVRGTIEQAAICSVVPRLTEPISAEIQKRFSVVPRALTAEAEHGLKFGYRNPRELGADRIAAALGARAIAGASNVVVVDCGTATTVTALQRDGTLLGGAIFPGLALWSQMLASKTAQLPDVPVHRRPRVALGRSTREGLQSGIFHGHAGAMRELVTRIRRESFGRGAVLVLGTGGNAAGFLREGIFSRHVPDLVLVGLERFARTTTAERL